MIRKVVATVLHFGAAASLERVLACLADQSRLPDRVLVLDNGSHHASVPEIASRYDVILLKSIQNLGVGGGHTRLFHAALEDPTVTHIWALEHDSYAARECLSNLIHLDAKFNDSGIKVGALCARLERNEEEAASRVGSSSEQWRVESQFTFNGVLFARPLPAKLT